MIGLKTDSTTSPTVPIDLYDKYLETTRDSLNIKTTEDKLKKISLLVSVETIRENTFLQIYEFTYRQTGYQN